MQPPPREQPCLRCTAPLTRRRFAQGLAAAAASGLLCGCGVVLPGADASTAGTAGDDGGGAPVTPAPAPAPKPTPVPTPTPTPAPSRVGVDVTVTPGSGALGVLPASFAGLGYEKNEMSTPVLSAGNAGLVRLLTRLGPGVLHISGNSVDQCLWTPAGAGGVLAVTAPADVDRLAGLLAATGWQVVYGVNLASSTPELAAAEASYAAERLGSHLLALSLGNEPDKRAAAVVAGGWSFAEYVERWTVFAAAITGSVPGIQLMGPETADNENWFADFAASAAAMPAGTLAALSHHYYRGDGLSAGATLTALLGYPDAQLTALLGVLATASGGAGLRFRITEANSFYNGGAPGISNAPASALWLLDDLFTTAWGGASGINLQGGGASYYTPVADNYSRLTAVMPEYYGLYLFSQAGSGALLPLEITGNGWQLSAYAVRSGAGATCVVLVNREPSRTLAVALTGFAGVTAAAVSVLSAEGAPTMSGASFGVDGSFAPEADAEIAAVGGVLTVSLGPYAAALLRLAGAG